MSCLQKGSRNRSGQEQLLTRINFSHCDERPERREGGAGISVKCSEHPRRPDRQYRLLLSVTTYSTFGRGSLALATSAVLVVCGQGLCGLVLEADSLPSIPLRAGSSEGEHRALTSALLSL